jgi:hypothetical protein
MCFRIYFAVDLSNGQLTPNNNTPLLTQALSGEVMLGIYIFMFFKFLSFFICCVNFSAAASCHDH